jgi:hypothetical protein
MLNRNFGECHPKQYQIAESPIAGAQSGSRTKTILQWKVIQMMSGSMYADESDAVDALLGREAVRLTRFEGRSETLENTRSPDGIWQWRQGSRRQGLIPSPYDGDSLGDSPTRR